MHTTATRDFVKARRKLMKAGCRQQVQKIHTAWTEAQMDGKIRVSRTHHGETRANVEKYDLGDGYRLVVYLVPHSDGHRVFLFAGSHDEVDRWLGNHGNYKWVYRPSDKTVEFVPVSTSVEPRPFDLSADVVERRLLISLADEMWDLLTLGEDARQSALSLTNTDVEEGTLDQKIIEISPDHAAQTCLFDICFLAYEGKANRIPARIELFAEKATVVEAKALSESLKKITSTEELITFSDPEDLKQLLQRENWEDWQLYLHPRQRHLTVRDYTGPARVRGISGSGKTCIAVHRARYLVEKYRKPVLLLTLTRSMSNLLRGMKDSLFGATSSRRVRVNTMSAAALKFLEEFDPLWMRKYRGERSTINIVGGSDLQELLDHAGRRGGVLPAFQGEASLSNRFNEEYEYEEYTREEIEYVRTTYAYDNRDAYITEPRVGRGLPLGEKSRHAVLAAVADFEEHLIRADKIDSAGIVLQALTIMESRIDWDGLVATKDYPAPLSRCVIVDESQDMTENELRLVSRFAPTLENALFLVGDGAQKVFSRGFAFSKAGIDVVGRSTVLKKNYRNTRQILEAAYPLVTTYVNETSEETSRYLDGHPDYSSRDGTLPEVYEFVSANDEVVWAGNQIDHLTNIAGLQSSDIAILAPFGLARRLVTESLEDRGIRCVELRSVIRGQATDAVRISTIESAKGHEFNAVFLIGLIEGALPTFAIANSGDLWLGAAKLYVAMTRARDNLYLSYATNYQRRPAAPSRYLETVLPYCEDCRTRA